MALRLDYFVQETVANLRRNLSLTIASLLTVAVSLALVGAALLLRQGVDNATTRWQGGIEFIVFLQPDVSQEQADAVGRELKDNPDVKDVKFVDKQQAYDEFKLLFRNSPELVDTVTPDILPASWRVVPSNTDPERDRGDRSTVREEGGRHVGRVREGHRRIGDEGHPADADRHPRGGQSCCSIAAGLLIVNTIRTAMLSRRREIEVMKLVGASNWFIRVPFIFEGLDPGSPRRRARVRGSESAQQPRRVAGHRGPEPGDPAELLGVLE